MPGQDHDVSICGAEVVRGTGGSPEMPGEAGEAEMPGEAGEAGTATAVAGARPRRRDFLRYTGGAAAAEYYAGVGGAACGGGDCAGELRERSVLREMHVS